MRKEQNLALVWMRRDLRLDDHPALHAAASRHATLLPVFCFDPREFETTGFGFEKTGPFRAGFLRHAVVDLRQRLEAAGAGLMIVLEKPESALPRLIRQFSARAVYFHREPTSEERAVERAVRNACSHGIAWHALDGHSLFHPADLPFTVDTMPDFFSPFRRIVEESVTPRPPLPAPASLAIPEVKDWGKVPQLEDLGLTPPPAEPRFVLQFTGGESAGLERLQQYVWKKQALKTYHETRNGMLDPDDSSKFSPWLAAGCLSPRRIYAEIKQFEAEIVANKSTYWLIFELLWRDYFRFLAEKVGNKLFALDGWRGGEGYRQLDRETFLRWRQGCTGQRFVDANMRELAATGFMSNRGRQNVASYWIHYLKQDWRAGAEWFESRLIDYDPCSNWGNWAYLAGVGSDPRPNRVFNPERQADRYDPDHAYVNRWRP